ncbi:MAG: Redox-sensing transcriptional repressor Rex [Phycisphaerae bacterium]|nr:Redox-sensing transcriptional repressor Rex [Phycisphaerae bacterium]
MSTNPESIPLPAVRRLSLYLRQLEALARSNQATVSSKELGRALRLTDAQVRKDLAYFGQFGHPGIGYRVDEVIRRIRRILGTDKTWNATLVGLGNLGQALAAYRGFGRKGFQLVAVFDADERKVGRPVEALEAVVVQPLRELRETVARLNVRLGIIAVPAEAAQAVADQLVAAGVRGILNFAPVALLAPPHVALTSVDLAVQLEQLSFQVGMQTSSVRPATERG